MKDEPKRINLYGLEFSNTNPTEVLQIIQDCNFDKPKYICFPSTNIASKIQGNLKMKIVFDNAWLTLPDGMMTQYYARFKGYKKLEMVSGYWLVSKLLNSNISHFFYGASDEVLSKMKIKIERDFPNAVVLGYKAPPFVKYEDIENNNQIREDFVHINSLRPDIIWIGISNLKQDLLMAEYVSKIDHGLLIGVGAVFLYLSGEVKMGPPWVKKLALRWLVRLIQEPKKEAKSLPSTFHILWLMIKEMFGMKPPTK